MLDSGQLLGIYPEGTRAPDLRLHKGPHRVARLSLRCDVPIVPVGIVGTRAVQPPGSKLLRPFHSVTIRFGPPVTYQHPARSSPPASAVSPPAPGSEPAERGAQEQTELRELTDTLMSEIARLSGQEYVDRYASRAKARTGDPDGVASSGRPRRTAGSPASHAPILRRHGPAAPMS